MTKWAEINLLRDLRGRHAVEAHDAEALETYETSVAEPGSWRDAGASPGTATELYDQDAEEFPNAVTILPSHCGLCGYKFRSGPWDSSGSLCPICGATTVVNR